MIGLRVGRIRFGLAPRGRDDNEQQNAKSQRDVLFARPQQAQVPLVQSLNLELDEMGFVREVADEVVFMDRGSIVERGPPSRVFDAPATERMRDFAARILRHS